MHTRLMLESGPSPKRQMNIVDPAQRQSLGMPDVLNESVFGGTLHHSDRSYNYKTATLLLLHARLRRVSGGGKLYLY